MCQFVIQCSLYKVICRVLMHVSFQTSNVLDANQIHISCQFWLLVFYVLQFLDKWCVFETHAARQIHFPKLKVCK